MFPISLRSKRAQLALRFFSYGVMTLATVLLTALAIFYAMGYRFNQSTLLFEQGGLVQFRSTPEGATVVVDGTVQDFKTPGRANLTAGVHTIVMQLGGYREWQRTVPIAPGQLLWLNYTRFIPNSVTTTPLKNFSTLAATLASPDRRWMLLQEKSDSPTLTLADLSNEKTPAYSNITLPDSKLSKIDGKYGQLTLVEWDLSSRYFIVHQQNGPNDAWLRVDRTNPGNTINISDLFRLNIGSVHFAGNNSNVVYAKTDDVLRRLDVVAHDASAALVDGVEQFDVYGDDTISFVAKRQTDSNDPNTTQQIVGLYANNKETVVQTEPADAHLLTVYGQYDNHSFLAIHKGDGMVQILRDPAANVNSKETAEFASFKLGQPAQWLKMSNSGRMITAGYADTVVTYDLEIGKAYQSTLGFLGANNTRAMQWLDDYYLWSDAGDRLQIVEFDGKNDREITTVAPGFDITLSQNGNVLFSVGKNVITNSYFLQASQLVKQ